MFLEIRKLNFKRKSTLLLVGAGEMCQMAPFSVLSFVYGKHLLDSNKRRFIHIFLMFTDNTVSVTVSINIIIIVCIIFADKSALPIDNIIIMYFVLLP